MAGREKHYYIYIVRPFLHIRSGLKRLNSWQPLLEFNELNYWAEPQNTAL